jgi:hypothetical protein
MSLHGWPVVVARWSARLLALLFLLATAVLLALGRRRPPFALWAAPAVLWLSAMSINAVPRFRTPVDPFLLLVIALAVDELLNRRRRATA